MNNLKNISNSLVNPNCLTIYFTSGDYLSMISILDEQEDQDPYAAIPVTLAVSYGEYEKLESQISIPMKAFSDEPNNYEGVAIEGTGYGYRGDIPIADNTFIVEGDSGCESIVILAKDETLSVEVFKKLGSNELMIVFNDNNISLIKEYFVIHMAEIALLSCIVKTDQLEDVFQLKITPSFEESPKDGEEYDDELFGISIFFNIYYDKKPPAGLDCIHISNFESIEFAGFVDDIKKVISQSGSEGKADIHFIPETNEMNIYVY